MILQVAKPGSVSTPAGMDCEYPIDKKSDKKENEREFVKTGLPIAAEYDILLLVKK